MNERNFGNTRETPKSREEWRDDYLDAKEQYNAEKQEYEMARLAMEDEAREITTEVRRDLVAALGSPEDVQRFDSAAQERLDGPARELNILVGEQGRSLEVAILDLGQEQAQDLFEQLKDQLQAHGNLERQNAKSANELIAVRDEINTAFAEMNQNPRAEDPDDYDRRVFLNRSKKELAPMREVHQAFKNLEAVGFDKQAYVEEYKQEFATEDLPGQLAVVEDAIEKGLGADMASERGAIVKSMLQAMEGYSYGEFNTVDDALAYDGPNKQVIHREAQRLKQIELGA